MKIYSINKKQHSIFGTKCAYDLARFIFLPYYHLRIYAIATRILSCSRVHGVKNYAVSKAVTLSPTPPPVQWHSWFQTLPDGRSTDLM